MAEPIVLGIVGIKNMGEYNSQTNYEKLNVVTYQGSSYCALQNTKGNTPTNTDYWQLYAEKGETGPEGPQGPKPVKGVDYYTSDDKEEIETDLADDIANAVSESVGSLTSATPLVASSVSGMTDTTRIYVNTADGHWYWYDGDSWEDGGVYQSTGLGDKSVNYNTLDDLLRSANFKQVKTEDLMWKKGISYYQGVYAHDTDIVSCTPFILPKGSTIDIPVFRRRITYFDLDGNYIGNTGSFALQSQPWSYSNTCLVIISMARPTVESDPIEESDCTNANIIFTGLVDRESYNLGKSIKGWTQFLNTRMFVSEPFFLEAGSKISITPNLTKKTNVLQNGPIYFNVQEEGISKDLGAPTAIKKDYYMVSQSGMVRIALGFVDSTDIQNGYLDNFATYFKIDKLEYIPKEELIVSYSSGNAQIDYKQVDGHLYLHLNNSYCLLKRAQDIISITMASLEELFPNKIVTVDSIKYLDISVNGMLYYDLNAKELKLSGITNAYTIYGSNIIPLAINKNNNFCGGLMLKDVSKQYSENMLYNKDLFNSHGINDYDWKTIVKNFNKLYNNKSTNINSFLFFTDPHLMGSNNNLNEKTLINYFNPLEKVYNSMPLDFICCGGDWLNDGDIQDEACFKLGYIDGFMNNKFKNYYPILGNHDTNYLGKINSESDPNTGLLSNDTLTNLMFNKFGNLYYSFKIKNTNYYVLDNGTNWWNTMNDYRWQQIDWLAHKLIQDNPVHATILLHILWYSSENVGVMTQPLTQLLNAFNNHTTITLNGVTYNFSSTTGHVDYVLSGHTHYDYNDTINNILCIATDKFERGTGTYDIIINDYDNHKVKLFRVGTGESREFNI